MNRIFQPVNLYFISIYFYLYPQMEGLIFSVKRYSIHDGPGIRVTFFMKGCPLSCRWCHNPEGISPFPESVQRTNRIGDREFRREEVAGKYYTIENILEILEKESVFINQSKGGVTFSGGEPMFQTDFLLEALKACKSNGYHTAVDTSGYAASDSFNSIVPYSDLFLFDIKHLDEVRHYESTGVSNTGIFENFQLLLKSGKDIMVRIPVIPGFNDDHDHMERLKNFIITTKTASLKMISLLPYHKIGSSKYKMFNLPYRMENTEPPSKEEMQNMKELFMKTGVKVKIGG
jgi:pyruvate formate lyase activating enzyme